MVNRSRRIAYIATAILPSRRANTVNIMHMCQAFRRSGHEITLVVPRHKNAQDRGVFDHYGIADRFPIKFISRPHIRIRGIDIGLHLFFLSAVFYALGNKFEICYTRNPFCAYVAGRLGMDTILEMHMPPESRSDAYAFGRMAAGKRLWRVVAISGRLAEILKGQFGMPLSMMLVCHDAVDLEPYEYKEDSRLKQQLGLDDEKVLVTYSGSLYEGRGMEVIVELARRFPECYFLVVGGDEARINIFRQEFSHLDNLHFYGYVPHKDVASILMGSGILVMPYERQVTLDGRGNTAEYCSPVKMFEYLAAAKPIIASRLPSISEILKDGENALLAEPEDVDSWSNGLSKLVTDDQLRRNLGRSARKTAETHTWDKRVLEIMNHFYRDDC